MNYNFTYYLNEYFNKYLPYEKNCSINTIKSYKYTFKLLINFLITQKGVDIKNLDFKDFTKDNIREFLNEVENKTSINSRNQRLGAIKSFFQYVSSENIDNLDIVQQILSIKSKKFNRKIMDYLTQDEIKQFLDSIQPNDSNEFRDLVLLSLLYDSAARASELLNIRVMDLNLNNNYSVLLHGKGNKDRRVPLTENTTQMLKTYIEKNNLSSTSYLFHNNRNEKHTTKMIEHIIKKYLMKSNITNKNIHPHSIRRSRAMHLLESGVSLIYIRDLLGHSNITTTEIYARTNDELIRQNIINAYNPVENNDDYIWKNDENLLKELLNL